MLNQANQNNASKNKMNQNSINQNNYSKSCHQIFQYACHTKKRSDQTQTWMLWLLIGAQLLVSQLASAKVAQAEHLFGKPLIVNNLTDPDLSEVSGVAQSIIDNKHVWAINDGGHGAKLYLLSSQKRSSGKKLLELSLENLANYDWEDLDSFELDGKPYLLIADVGDNLQRRKVYYLHMIPEPQRLRDAKGNYQASIDLSSILTIGFQYEDGSRDCESVAVDVANRKILLLSKRDKPARLYTLPLNTTPSKNLYKATLVSEMPHISKLPLSLKGSFLQKLYPNMPTAMSMRDKEVAVLTYRNLYLFDYTYSQTSGLQAPKFAKKGVINLPQMPQAEAMSFLPDGQLMVFSEKVGSPIVLIERTH